MPGAELAFDSYAVEYDQHFTGSATGKLQRARVRKFFSAISPEQFPEVLELGCGTGEDARWLSEKGFKVTATDASEGMVTVAKQKLANTSAEVCVCDAQEVARVFAGRKFDLLFSDFGALNCLSPEDFWEAAAGFASLLRPGGKLVLVLMGRKCKWERFYFKRKGEAGKAFRRMSKEGVETEISGEKFYTWYYSPAEMQTFFEKDFKPVRVKPVGLFLPPSYLDNYFSQRPGRLKFLNLLEKIFAFAAFSDLADHYFLELKKR